MFCLRLLALTFLFVLGATGSARADSGDVDLDLSSPRRALATFIQSAGRGDFQRATQVLNLPANASASRKAQATELARKLEYMLARNASLDVDRVSDDPAGRPEDGADSERVTTFESRGRTVQVTLIRVGTPERWVFSPGTLARVPELYESYGPSPLEERMPPELRREALGLARWQWIGLALAIAVAFAVAEVVVRLLHGVTRRFAARTRVLWDDELAESLKAPSKLLVSVLVFLPLAHALGMPANFRLMSLRAASTLGIWAVTWFLMRIVALISNAFERRALGDPSRVTRIPPAARGVQTRVRILRRVVNVVLAICAGALILMQFETMRSLGLSLLASAGVAGVVLGIAAQRTLGSVFAGIQLSITQPIRIGDEVIVEGDFGTIEEITLTYVVMRVWDERRVIIPTNYFFEQPFQNWTKVGTDLHGTVMLYCDYGLPVDRLRAELEHLITDNPLWDKRTKVVHVTDAREKTMELRVLVSSSSAGKLFQLRAELREKLTAWLASYEDGRYLPKTRLEEPDGAKSRPAPGAQLR